MVYKRVRGWTSGRSLPHTKLLIPPLPPRVCGGESWLHSFLNKNSLRNERCGLFSNYNIFLLQPDGTDLFHFVDGYSSWNAYLTTMMADGTWGDHVILHGAANCFETCVHVISSLPHHHDVIICPEYDVTGSNRLVLGHVYELHYVSLIPLEGC